MDYPGDWALAVDYGRYGDGLMSAELNNKKCGSAAGQCDSECIDARVLAGKIPESGATPGLFTQLYEDFMMVRDFSTASLVNALDFDSQKVFKVADNGPTLALNGRCPGPLYVFETKTGYFVYVFAGGGQNAAIDPTIEKIINSIEIAGPR
jgi:hypothetical protein